MPPISNNPITNNPPAPAGEVLVRVEGVGKTFCRDLKQSLWYGVRDIAAVLVPGRRGAERHATLRPDEFRAVDDISFELRHHLAASGIGTARKPSADESGVRQMSASSGARRGHDPRHRLQNGDGVAGVRGSIAPE